MAFFLPLISRKNITSTAFSPHHGLRIRSVIRVLPVLSCVFHCTVFPVPVSAENYVIEEVIITAQKREQSVQDVGIAITAFSGDQMKELGFEDSYDVARMTPGVHIGGSIAGQTSLFTIRGVTQNDFTDSVESPVAVYIDEGYIAMATGQTFGLFDVERVEIVKGPQGTLFGRNATGGLVHYISRKPTEEFEGYLDVTYGDFDQVRFEGAIGGPISDSLAGRISLFYNSHNEILENEFPSGKLAPTRFDGGSDLWNDDTLAGRVHLQFTPNNDVKLLLSISAAEMELSEAPNQSSPTLAIVDDQNRVINTVNAAANETCEARGPSGCIDLDVLNNFQAAGGLCFSPDGDTTGAVCPILNASGFGPDATGPDGLRPVPGGDIFGYIDPDGDGFNTSKDFAFDDIDEFTTFSVTANLSWDFDDFTFTSITDYKNYDKFIALDIGAAPANQSMFLSEAEEDTFTQELRLNGELERFRWVGGFYFLYINNDTINGLSAPTTSPLTVFVGTDALNEISLNTKSYSLFGQIEYDLTDALTFITGLRVLREEKEYDFMQSVFTNTNDKTVDNTAANFLFSLRTPFSEDTEDDLWAGKIQLDWHPTEDWLVYGGVNRGVKAGSFNAKLADGTPPITDDHIPYDEEILLSYEVGFKSTLRNGKLQFNGAAFYYDYKDYQAFTFSGVSGVISNEDATVLGMELDVWSSPVEGLDLMFGVSSFDAEVEDVQIAPGIFRNVEPAYAPQSQLAGLVRYEWPVLNGKLAIQVDANYSDEFFHNLRNFDSQKYDSYTVANARLTYTGPEEKWQLSAWVNNFTDERYRLVGFDLATLCGCNEDSYGKPRWWGVTFHFNL